MAFVALLALCTTVTAQSTPSTSALAASAAFENEDSTPLHENVGKPSTASSIAAPNFVVVFPPRERRDANRSGEYFSIAANSKQKEWGNTRLDLRRREFYLENPFDA